ncbi:Las1-domain-containing protein [Trametes polyzona]|nr:Las1-domain-containing protein [Trametes polyzona]
MRLPRRVPWQDLNELEQVCGWIYAEENDLDAKRRAVNRLAVWKAAVPLPHALESAHAILSVILQDGPNSSAASSSSFLSLRMSYAAALIRLVNGLVDPLQLGAYARSINSIAQQLGLPAWFVELRHAATHEDLPSLEVLRDAAREGMAWLLHNYFLPTLNPSSPGTAPSQPLRPLAPLLKQYKTLLKATTRDATLRVQLRGDITKATREVERWIAEAKVASAAASGAVGWEDAYPDGDEEDARERWALDRLAEALIQRGALVPLSKKKRLSSGPDTLALPRSSLLIWSPLLTHLQSLHPTLSLHLVSAITAHLAQPTPSPSVNTSGSFDGPEIVSLSAPTPADEPRADPSYDLCLASWAKWLVDNSPSASSSDDLEDLRDAALVRIVSALGPDRASPGNAKSASALLLHALSAERPKLATALSVLSQPPAQASASGTDWDESTIDVMDRRLSTLLALSASAGNAQSTAGDDDAEMGDAEAPDAALPAGWRKLGARNGWRPAPIGVYVACA